MRVSWNENQDRRLSIIRATAWKSCDIILCSQIPVSTHGSFPCRQSRPAWGALCKEARIKAIAPAGGDPMHIDRAGAFGLGK